MEEKIEFFVHVQGEKPKVIAAESGEILRDVLIRSGILKEGDRDVHVFAGECEQSLKESGDLEDGADDHAPVDAGLALRILDIKRLRHVHCHRCRQVAVEVNFGGKSVHRKFSPAATIETVTRWARRKFRLDPAAAGEYVLQICGSSEQPRPNSHLGELVEASKCAACFDLVKEVTPQG